MLKDIKVIFMGTPEFSTDVLKMLITNTNVIGVVTQPDKLVGRKKELVFSPVKKIALENNIKIFQPIKIRNEYKDILAMKPDIIITTAYGQMIPKSILDFPKYGCINVHGSLLPKLRGGAPIQHAIIDGYKKTGITIMYMATGMDSGDIISQEEIEILETDTYKSLHDKLKVLGSSLLLKTLPSIINGTNSRIEQNTNEITFGYNIKREEELLNFNDTKEEIYNKIRGLNEEPGSYFLLDNKIIKVYMSEKVEDLSFNNQENGEIVLVDKKSFSIKTKNGLLKILEIKPEGKNKMPVANFLNGNKNLLGKIVNKGVIYER